MKYGPENWQVVRLARLLDKSKKKAPAWKRVAELLRKRGRRKKGVNLYSLEKHCKEGETVVVPDRVLSLGKISKKLTVAALSVSKPAASKLASAGCKLISIARLVEQNPEAKGVKIII